MMIAFMRMMMVAGLLVLAGFASAHDGHTHTVMGVVWKVSSEQLEVKTKDGKTETIRITDKTAVSRGKDLASFSSLKPGERVVVDVGEGKKPLTAKGIKVGVTEPTQK